MPHVVALRVAPVKALATVQPHSVLLSRQGVAEDRRLFLLEQNGAVATLRSHPSLTQVVPELDLGEGRLSVRMPNGEIATSDLDRTEERVSARLFGKERNGHVVPGPVASALSSFVAAPLRLVLADTTGVGWDEGPVSIVGQASVLATRAPAAGGTPAARFRMLVELDGIAPYEEDSWVGRVVRIGDAVLRVEHPLGRCLVINRSPDSGEVDWAGLKALSALRGEGRVDGTTTLGVIATVETPGEVSVGDTAVVLADQMLLGPPRSS